MKDTNLSFYINWELFCPMGECHLQSGIKQSGIIVVKDVELFFIYENKHVLGYSKHFLFLISDENSLQTILVFLLQITWRKHTIFFKIFVHIITQWIFLYTKLYMYNLKSVLLPIWNTQHYSFYITNHYKRISEISLLFTIIWIFLFFFRDCYVSGFLCAAFIY